MPGQTHHKKTHAERIRLNQQRLWDGEIEFRANLADDLTHNKYGEMVCKLSIPFEEVEEAVNLRRLVGLPVFVTVKLWTPFAEFIRNGELPDREHDV